MKIAIVIATLLIPLGFVLLGRKWARLRLLIDALAVVSGCGLAILTAFAVIDIREHHTVYGTEVHGVFDSFWYMTFAGYVGLYALSKLLGEAWLPYRRDRKG